MNPLPGNDAAQTRLRRRLLLLGLAVALCALLGSLAARYLAPSMLAAGAPRPGANATAGSAPRPVHPSRSDDPNEVASGTPRSDAAPDLPPVKPVAPEDAPEAAAELQLRCVDTLGNPVSGVTLQITAYQPGPVSRRLRVRKWDCPVPASGKVSLFSSRGDLARITLQSDAWYLQPGEDLPFGGPEHELQLHRTASITVRARFDDGVAVTGDAAFLCPETGGSWNFRLRDGAGEARGVALVQGLQCCVMAQYRFPYQMHVQDVPLDEITSGRIVEIVVKLPAKPRCRIRLELEDSSLTERHAVMLEQEPGFRAAHMVRIQAGTQSWESADLRPEGRFRVTVLGDTAWRSDWFEVQPGETKVVTARLRQGATVTAVIADAEGVPMPGACLRVCDGSYLSFSSPGQVSVNPWQGAVADADGRVNLSGLPTGAVEVEADGWHCTAVRQQVTLFDGAAIDLGQLRLGKAGGEVFVEVVGGVPGREYSIVVDQPGGAPVLPAEKLAGARHRITGLASRKYMIGIVFTSGGTIVWASVDLSAQTSPSITLDASTLRPD